MGNRKGLPLRHVERHTIYDPDLESEGGFECGRDGSVADDASMASWMPREHPAQSQEPDEDFQSEEYVQEISDASDAY